MSILLSQSIRSIEVGLMPDRTAVASSHHILSLNNLISVQPSFRLLALHLLSLCPNHALTSSKLKITNRSFRYASPYLWNKFPLLFRQPSFPDELPPDEPPSPYVISSLSSSPVLLSITPSLFHSKIKTYLFLKSSPPQFIYF